MLQKIFLVFIYLASGLLFIGGFGDQFINELLGVHLNFLGNPETSPLLDRAQSLILMMLHVLGGGLMAAGVACLFITHFALRKGESWARLAIFLIATLSEGFNAWGMYSAGSYWIYPVSVLALLYTGLIFYKPHSP